MKNKKILIFMLIVFCMIVLLTSTVHASFQSIGVNKPFEASYDDYNEETLDTLEKFMLEIRRMETSGAGLGLNETIDSNTLLSETSNKIDVHMQKNTEYGAVVLLGASNFGKQGQTIEDRKMQKGSITGATKQASSTGNKYGVYELSYYIDPNAKNQMSSASGYYYDSTVSVIENFLNSNRIANRYVDIYKNGTPKIGDATIETLNWHGDADSEKFSTKKGRIISRGTISPFSFLEDEGSFLESSRAVIVVGEGV